MDLRNLVFNVDFKGKETPVSKMDSAVDNLKKSVASSTDMFKDMEKTIKKSTNTRPIDSIESATKDFLGTTEKTSNKVSILGGTLNKIKSSTAIQKLNGGMQNLKKSAGEAVKKLKDINPAIEGAGKSLSAKVTAPIVGLATTATYTVSKFDDSMSQVAAISGATGKDFDNLRNKAKELGSTTAHSASAAADGMGILATAGWNANQILEGTPHLLSLASASGLELAQAGDIITNTLGQFSLKASDAGMVSDVLAKAASSSQTNVEQMAEAMKYAGGSAATMNMDVAQTSAILGTLANQSVKGSAAGTAFTAMFNDLSKAAEGGAIEIGKAAISVYDANGKMKDMGSIMADIESATNGMSDAQRNQALQSIFGVQSMRGVNAILTEGTGKYKELEKNIRDSKGAAAEMADEMENNIGGAFRSMKSAIEGFMIDIGDVFKNDVSNIATGIGNMARKFGELDEGTQKTIVKTLAFAASIGPLLFGISKVNEKINNISPAMETMKTAMGLVASPIGLTVLAIVGLIGALVYLYNTNEEVRNLLLSVWDSLKTGINATVEFIKGVWSVLGDSIMNIASIAWGAVENIITMILNVIQGAIKIFTGVITGDWSAVWDGIKQIVVGVFDFFKELPAQMLDIGINIIKGLIQGVKSMAGAAKDAVVGVAKGIAGGIKGFFGIHSPAKLTIGYGENITEGLGIGMENEAPGVNSITKDINQQLDYSLEPGTDTSNVPTVGSTMQHISFSPNVKVEVNGNGNASEQEVSNIESKVNDMMDKFMDEFFAKLSMQM
ncbi:phage tail tape measure protein [Clostridium cochlearium]|uniref:phage tail tape measure protein n=1 Tax=Clostridium cochlearium TaxID=1494 RepID=UPI00241D28DC|nr:phage tail tape measure protein [Clostridium cochlearium]